MFSIFIIYELVSSVLRELYVFAYKHNNIILLKLYTSLYSRYDGIIININDNK